jgi:hypothetical protein
MGVLPLCFKEGESAGSLGLTGEESFDIHLPVSAEGLVEPRCDVKVTATKPDGKQEGVHGQVPHRYPRRGRVLPQRRRAADGSAEAAEPSRKPVGV